jgi:hypothetical protein
VGTVREVIRGGLEDGAAVSAEGDRPGPDRSARANPLTKLSMSVPAQSTVLKPGTRCGKRKRSPRVFGMIACEQRDGSDPGGDSGCREAARRVIRWRPSARTSTGRNVPGNPASVITRRRRWIAGTPCCWRSIVSREDRLRLASILDEVKVQNGP